MCELHPCFFKGDICISSMSPLIWIKYSKKVKNTVYNVTVLCYTMKERRGIMDSELISKKDLLELTGISYGQLYRWKRKKLVPEEWFIRKSTFTGQETFFPKDKIMERLDKIKDMKDDLSLDNMAEMFSPELADILLKREEMLNREIVSKTTIEMYEAAYGEIGTFSFGKILYLAVLDKFLESGAISIDDGRTILKTLEEYYPLFKDKQCDMVFTRKLGVSICFLALSPNEICMEKNVKLMEKVNLQKCIESLKLKLV
jgi:hypothetical protein